MSNPSVTLSDRYQSTKLELQYTKDEGDVRIELSVIGWDNPDSVHSYFTAETICKLAAWIIENVPTSEND